MLRRRKPRYLFCTLLTSAFLVNLSLISFFRELDNYKKEDRQVLCVTSGICVALPDADGLLMKPDLPPVNWALYQGDDATNDTDRRIFFHETSGYSELSLRQCCAIESAAKHHPDRPVQLFLRPFIYFSDEYSNYYSLESLYKPAWLEVLSQYHNVDVILIHEDHYFAGTPLEEWQRKGEWRSSIYEVAHLSDYIRILTMYKGGGLYLDMDILTLKPFSGEKFRNFLVYGNAEMGEISNGAMHIERGHWMPGEIIRLLAKEYDPKAYVYHGPDAISEVMNRVCGLVAGNPKSNQCTDVQLLSDSYFYPIPSIFSHVLFQNTGNKTDIEMLTKIRESFGLHLWQSLSRFHEPLQINSNQVVAVIAHQHCPLTINRANEFKSL